MSSNTSTSWFYTVLVLALAHTGGAQVYDARGAGSAVQGVPLVAFQDTGTSPRIHPTKMAVGKDRKIYFNSSLAIVYRIQAGTDAVEVAGSIWVIDIRQLDHDGVATPIELIRDVNLGTAVDVVSGFHFGVDPEQANRLYVSDGSLDTFFWLNGDPNGTPFPPDETPEPGVPFPMNTYHAAIRMIELDEWVQDERHYCCLPHRQLRGAHAVDRSQPTNQH